MTKSAATFSEKVSAVFSLIKKYRVGIILALILAVGAFARFYQLEHYMRFYVDEVNHATVVRNFVTEGKPMVKGPAAVDRDGYKGYLGPAYYYLVLPAYVVSGFRPIGAAVFVALVNIFAIWMLYWLGKTMFNKNVGLFSAFILSVSMMAIYYSRWPWNPNILLPFVMGAIYAFYQMTEGKKGYIWLLTFCLAIAAQLHSTGFLLLPIIGALWVIYQPKVSLKLAAQQIPFFMLLYTPLIAYDIKNHFSNSYAYLHTIFSKSEASNYVKIGFVDGLVRIMQYATKHLSAFLTQHKDKDYLAISLLFASAALLVSKISFKRTELLKNKSETFLFVWIGLFLFFSSFYHFDIWDYYFMAIWPAILLMIGCFLDSLWQKKLLAKVVVLAILVLLTRYTYDTAVWTKNNLDNITKSNYGLYEQVTFGDMQSLVQAVVADSTDHTIEVKFYSYSLPIDIFKGTYFYLFDVLGQGKVVTEDSAPETHAMYVILQPYFADHEDFSVYGSVEWTKRIGNLALVKIQKP